MVPKLCLGTHPGSSASGVRVSGVPFQEAELGNDAPPPTRCRLSQLPALAPDHHPITNARGSW